MKKNILLLAAFVQVLVFNSAFSQVASFTLSPTTTNTTTVCSGTPINFNSTASTPGAGATLNSWSWDFDVGGINGAGAVTVPGTENAAENPMGIIFNASGLYAVELTIADDNGGTDAITVNITVDECDGLNAGYTFDDNACDGDCITFRDTSTGGPVTWSWSAASVTPPGGLVTIVNENSKTTKICFENGSNVVHKYGIQLTVTDAAGLPATITNQITVNPVPSVTTVRDTIIDVSEAADLIAISTGGETYEWEPAESVSDPTELITFARPHVTTPYAITVTDINGCTAVDTLIVYVNYGKHKIGVPTAFSPNGDGLNDLLVVEGYAIEEMRFKIYNRYGQLLFETGVQKNGWDGNFRGRPEDPGVYLWTLDYKFSSGQEGKMSGNTTLVR